MNSKIIYFLALLLCLVLIVPFFVKKNIDTKIDLERTNLLENGIDITILNENGYFYTTREFELKITNGKKFRDYALVKFAQKNPNYKGLIELFQKESNKNIRPMLDGITFKGNMTNSNLIIGNSTIELYLTKLSDEAMISANRNEKSKKFIDNILNEKLFTFFITLTRDFKVSQIVMKDIDKNFEEDNKIVKIKLKNHKLNLDIDENINGTYILKELLFGVDDEVTLEINGINYGFDYATYFDNKEDITVKNAELRVKNEFMKTGNIEIKNSIQTLDDHLKVNLLYLFKDIYFSSKKDTLELDDVSFELNIDNLDKEGTTQLNKVYTQVVLNQAQGYQKMLQEATKKIINKGFNIDLKTSLNNFTLQNIDLKHLEFSLHSKLEKNNYDLGDNRLINLITANGYVKLNKKDFKNILKQDRSLQQFFKFAKEDGDNLIFEYKFENNKLYINDKEIK